MSKEDLGKLIDSKKFSKTMYCYGDDKLGNFIKEIYLQRQNGETTRIAKACSMAS